MSHAEVGRGGPDVAHWNLFFPASRQEPGGTLHDRLPSQHKTKCLREEKRFKLEKSPRPLPQGRRGTHHLRVGHGAEAGDENVGLDLGHVLCWKGGGENTDGSV